MSYKEMFFVQVFTTDSKGRLVGGRSYSLPDAHEAMLKAKWLSEKVIGVVAFSQMVDEKAGDADEPTLLVFYGRVPDEARAQAVA